jgi:hypothetical protein
MGARRRVTNYSLAAARIAAEEHSLYGHTHDVQIYSSHGHTASDVLIGGSLGCLCEIPQKYLKGGPTRWQHFVTVFEWDTCTGEFWFHPIRINNGRLIYNGRVFGG